MLACKIQLFFLQSLLLGKLRGGDVCSQLQKCHTDDVNSLQNLFMSSGCLHCSDILLAIVDE